MPNIFCINPDSHDGIVYHSNKQQNQLPPAEPVV